MALQKKLLILQSNYIPWQGYFDLIRQVDEFVVYDCVQYTKRDWRNRNYIKTPSGSLALTIPVLTKGLRLQPIDEVKVVDHKWAEKHFKTLETYYKPAPFYSFYRDEIAQLYAEAGRLEHLSEINLLFINKVMDWLNIKTPIVTGVQPAEGLTKTAALVDICEQRAATAYLSGPAAQAYIEPNLFEEKGVGLEFYKYPKYDEYLQLYPPFQSKVSILDTIFNNRDAVLTYFNT